jgi:hypothetical protein
MVAYVDPVEAPQVGLPSSCTSYGVAVPLKGDPGMSRGVLRVLPVVMGVPVVAGRQRK